MSDIVRLPSQAAPSDQPWTLRGGLATVARAGAGATVLVTLIGVMTALLAAQQPPSRVHVAAWTEDLAATLGGPAARCVSFRMTQRVSEFELEAMLATDGDFSRRPRIARLLAASIERCRAEAPLRGG